MKIEQIPANACNFAIADVVISDSNGPDAKTAPFKMIARSGKAIDHPYWGRIVHDNSGVDLPQRGRVAIDFAHTSEVIGYANHFEVNNDGDLVVSGALVPFASETDRAAEVIYKSHQGIPWEASINWGGTGIEIERVESNQSTQVNGTEFTGPGVVVRRWPLRGVAILPYGADQWTATEFSKSDQVLVTVKEPTEMSKTFAEAEAVIAELLDPNTETEEESTDSVEAVDVSNTEEAATPVAAVDAELSQRIAMFQTTFGEERGAVLFCAGLSFEQAMQQHMLSLAAENDRLKQQLQASKLGGESTPVTAGERLPPKTKTLPVRDPF